MLCFDHSHIMSISNKKTSSRMYILVEITTQSLGKELHAHFYNSLSVTKWVHLNWGDDGLIYLLLKCYSLLKKFGMLILEYQCFPSYHKKCNYSERIKKNYDTIQIKPEQIPAILQKVGMQLISSKRPNAVSTLPRAVTKGFNRPIVVMKKVGDELDIDFSKVKVKDIRTVIDVNTLIE